MKVEIEPYQLRLPRDASRPEGLHLSSIIKDLAMEMGVLDRKYDKELDDVGSEIAQLGIAFEDYLAKYQYGNTIDFHPGTLLLDGIYMSPDGIGIVDDEDYADMLGIELGSYIISEFKLSRKSSRGFKEALINNLPKAKMWLWQIKSYRHAFNKLVEGTETPTCNVAKLHAFFLNGSYDAESKPEFVVYRLHFTTEELEDNWCLMRSHAEVLARRINAT